MGVVINSPEQPRVGVVVGVDMKLRRRLVLAHRVSTVQRLMLIYLQAVLAEELRLHLRVSTVELERCTMALIMAVEVVLVVFLYHLDLEALGVVAMEGVVLLGVLRFLLLCQESLTLAVVVVGGETAMVLMVPTCMAEPVEVVL